MSGASFTGSGLTGIQIENGNQHFQVKNGFIRDLSNRRLVRYSGAKRDVEIESDVDVIGTYCSASRDSLRTLTFGAGCKLSLIEDGAFSKCGLQSITIPSSLISLGKSAFFGCGCLRTVCFASDSQLREIGGKAFYTCRLLESIILPASVEIIGAFCFVGCVGLASVFVPVDSKLVRIEKAAFSDCSALHSFFFPSLLEFVGEKCFYCSSCLTTLTFGSPSRLRELLDLPPLWIGCCTIPDSVERFSFCGNAKVGRTLEFGGDSRLAWIRARNDAVQQEDVLNQSPLGANRLLVTQSLSAATGGERLLFRTFVRLSSRTLKILRNNLEFG
jgi:hypothetical protein